MMLSWIIGSWKPYNLVLILLTFSLSTAHEQDETINCKEFIKIVREAKSLVETKTTLNSRLERMGYVSHSSIFEVEYYDKCLSDKVKIAEILTVAAQLFKSRSNLPLENFKRLADRCTTNKNLLICKKAKAHPKYRPIDGKGNNLNNPEWGAADTPFSRFGSKNFEDGINTIKKSVIGRTELPNARLLVQEVLMKAVRSPKPPLSYNLMGLFIILFATHDLHYQVPMHYRKDDIGCCSKGNRDILQPTLSNSACLPIEVSKNDTFYKNGNIGCLNMVRSQLGKYSCDIQAGEVLNRATSYLDLSLIYGSHESELKPIRLYKSGKLRMGKNNVLPVDSSGKYLRTMDRFTSIPSASIWPSLFARNHNHLAERLAKLNPHWNDEITFQEARRINIANFQFNLITAKSIERVFNKVVNSSYSDKVNAATSVEFAFTYRGGHYYIPNEMVFHGENNTEVSKHLQSDTIGKIELLENGFDEALRGALNQPVNTGQYSDEIINRIGKNCDGYGVDLIALDIQRGRDHGIPSFLEIRRKCQLTPEINSFDDFSKIFSKANVELLKNIYKSHEDVDFYVGGLLEAFESVGNPFAGPTFGCIIGTNYNNAMGGDIYFYSHPENPHPFTQAQLDAVSKYTVSNLFCINSGLKDTNKLWSYAPHPINPKEDCKNFPPIDLTAWKE